MLIVMTQEQRDLVAGDTGKGSILDPRRTADGHYVLSTDVLTDEAHSAVWGVLSQFETTNLEPVWEEE